MKTTTSTDKPKSLLRFAASLWAPPADLSLSEWAESFAVLSPETSAEPGSWRPYPYQIGILDAFTDPEVETITVMKSARVGYTKILDHAIGYGIAHDPAPMLVVQPTIEDAEDYSKDELDPMFRDTPVLAGRVSEQKSRSASNTIKRKRFPGGTLYLVGANAPRGFRRITVKRVFFDEVDGYPTKGAGVEGDQIALGKRRTDTFRDRKIALGGTPTIKGASRVEASFEQSDRRFYFVPCPHCGDKRPLVWEDFKWPEGKPSEIVWVCGSCGATTTEAKKRWMIERGEWIATAPFNGHAGFHIWAGYSYAPNASWPKLAAEFEDARKLPLTLKVFWNTILGRSFEESGEHPAEGSLMARAERWEGEPEGVLVRTMGVDVQGDRLEFEVVGWGVDLENWSLHYGVIWGDPSVRSTWDELTAAIGLWKPRAVAIDSGGHHTQAVYSYCNPARRIYAVKGAAGRRPVWPPSSSRGKTKGSRRPKVFVLGVDAAKDEFYSQLKLTRPGPGYCHFPEGRDERWYLGLTSESVFTSFSKGFPVREYRKRAGIPNEPLDCRVYAYAALCSFGKVNWKAVAKKRAPAIEAAREAEEIPQEPTPDVAPDPDPVNKPAPRRTRKRLSSWVSGWRG